MRKAEGNLIHFCRIACEQRRFAVVGDEIRSGRCLYTLKQFMYETGEFVKYSRFIAIAMDTGIQKNIAL